MAGVSWGEVFMAEALAWITARGERSSWEAAAINSACFCLLSFSGARVFPTNFQLTPPSRRNPRIPAAAKNRP